MHNPDKFIFDTVSIEKECYSLLAFFLASPSLHSLAKAESQSALHILPLYEQQLIKEILISIAIKVRMIDDLMKSYNRTSYLPTDEFVNVSCPGKTAQGGIREACNKIIHAGALVYQESSDRALLDKITLRGDKGTQDWIAQFSIISFIRATCELCRKYDEDGEVSGYTC